MKHKAFRWIPAVLLAALLAGCGAKTAASARPAGSRELKSTPPDSMHATVMITEQYTLEKVVQAENGGKVRLNIHLPRLESDSADAARINAEIAQLYEYDVLDYADSPAAADPDVWDFSIEMNWNASWYGDCVSLVVSSDYGGTDAPFHQGWCFDFENGNQLTNTQMLQRMGADPAALEEALYRDVKRRDELDRQAAIERGMLPTGSLKEGNTAWWTSLDELPFSLDGKGNISFVVHRFSASGGEDVNDIPVIPLDAQPLPPDWEWQVLAEWMAVTAVTQGESCAPADRNESFTLRLEKAEITGTVTVSFIRETYVSPQIRSAAETRTGELNAGAVTRWDGEKKSGLEPDLPQRGRQKPLDHLHDGGRLFADAVHRPEKGRHRVVCVPAYGSVGRHRLHRHPPQAVGHLPRRRRGRKGHPLDDLSAGRQLLHERGMGRVERHPDRHRRGNTGPHRGRHRAALYTDRHGRQALRVLGHPAER